MADNNRELREERARLAKRMSELSDKGLQNSADREEFERCDAEQKRLKDRIDMVERADELYKETRQTGKPPRGAVGGAEGPTEQHDREYRKAFRNYLAVGMNDLDVTDRGILRRETRDMGTSGSGAGIATSGGGILVPVGFVHDVDAALKYYGPMLAGDGSGRDGYPTVIPTETGQILPWSTSNDTTVVGEIIGEGQQVSMYDVSLGSINFGAFKFSSKLVKVSMELLQDSAFPIEDWLKTQFATRLGRILNTKFTTGAGTTEPFGIVTQATSGGTAAGAGTNDGTSGANTIGSDDLTTLEHSVDPLYRRNAKYMFHDSVLASLKKIKDKYGRPLWMPAVSAGAPDTINGYGYLVNNDMDQLQTQVGSPPVTKKVALFGAIDKFTIRRVKEMSVLRLQERFADQGIIAFIAFCRYDSALLDSGTHPVKYLQTTY